MKEPSAKYWWTWYAVVLVILVAQILFFNWLSQKF
jgi:hypothetical protein